MKSFMRNFMFALLLLLPAAAMAASPLYVADGYNDRIQAFAPDGRLLRKWGGHFAVGISGPFNGWFRVATSVATDPKGNIIVADFYNNRVQKWWPQAGKKQDGKVQTP